MARARKRRANELSSDEQYANAEFWDSREKEKNFHEWYFTYEDLKPLIADCVLSDSSFNCLEVGCGFAPLIEGANFNYNFITLIINRHCGRKPRRKLHRYRFLNSCNEVSPR